MGNVVLHAGFEIVKHLVEYSLMLVLMHDPQLLLKFLRELEEANSSVEIVDFVLWHYESNSLDIILLTCRHLSG